MTGFQGDVLCPTHGWAPHVFIHEAAHVVAAVDHGIPFEGVSIYSPRAWQTNNDNEATLGGVMVGPDPAAWVVPNPIGALEFVLAGSLTEDMLLGDFLPSGFTGDQRAWRQGLGATGELTPGELDELAGGSLQTVVMRVRAWAAANRSRIMRVAARLSGAADLRTPVVIGVDDGPWQLTAAEVRELC